MFLSNVTMTHIDMHDNNSKRVVYNFRERDLRWLIKIYLYINS